MDSLATLQRLGGGKFLDQIAQHLAEVAQEVVRTGNKGAVSAVITVERVKGEPLVIVNAVVQPKPPAELPQGAAFYALDDALWNDDPRQVRMEFRVIDEATGEIRETADAEPQRRVVD